MSHPASRPRGEGIRPPRAAQAPDPGRAALAEAMETSFRVLRWGFVVLILLYVASGFFIVESHERAYVLTWGRVRGGPGARALEPGAHWTWPKPVSEIVRIPAGRVRTIEVDPLPPAPKPGEPTAEIPESSWDELLITGDANLIRAHWALRYTISDPWQFHFGHADAARTLECEFRRTVVRTVAGVSIDFALRQGVETLRASAQDTLAARVAQMKLGVSIDRVDVPGLIPPHSVAQAFDDVVKAENERSQRISEARGAASRLVEEARGEAARRLSAARADRQRLISETDADAQYFERLLPDYQARPELVARTLLQDTLRRVLAATDQKYLLYHRADGGQELRLWLGPELPKPPAPPPLPDTPEAPR